MDVSDGTVRNRIKHLEDIGVIEGYIPMIDYELAGHLLQTRSMCTAPIVERKELARRALELEGVVEVHEVMTGRRKIEVKAFFPRHEDMTLVAKDLDEMGLDIESEELITHNYLRPFHHFGTEPASDEEDEDAGVYEI